MELYILIPGRKENRFRQQPLFWCITYYTIYVLHISFLLFSHIDSERSDSQWDTVL